MAAVDAQTLWMSAKIPSDQFLLYGFAGRPADFDAAVAAVRDRAQHCGELNLLVADRGPVRYPAWVRSDVRDDQFVVHQSPDTWSTCLAAMGELAQDQLDAAVTGWRLHLFGPMAGVPGGGDTGTVAVLQLTHALADGARASALAAELFGRAQEVRAPATDPLDSPLVLPWRAYRASHTHRQLVRDTAAGLVAPPAESRPALRSNAAPSGTLSLRTLIRRRAALPGPSVTIAVLAAVSVALSEHLTELGDDTSQLGAEVPMAKSGVRRAHNHFGNVGVGLYPQLERAERVRRIAADLARRRRRAQHPAMLAASRAFAAVPAPLLRWGVAQFDPTLRSPTATGNTVVSSVNRGAADLRFGPTPVVMTAGYPALSPMMGVTHGAHGIGETVAVSVHAAESAIGDLDAYVDRLDAALGRDGAFG
jgi:hypothetical protein